MKMIMAQYKFDHKTPIYLVYPGLHAERGTHVPVHVQPIVVGT